MTLKKLIFENGNYLSQEKIELWGFNNILKCHYKQINTNISKDPVEKNELYLFFSQEVEREICSLVNKIDFSATASKDDYLEGGSAGHLTILSDDDTMQTKEFGSYLPEDINNLHELIIDSLDIDKGIHIEWLLTELLIYYVLATSKKDETLTLNNCNKVLQTEIELSEKGDTLFNKLPKEHPVTELYNMFGGMFKTTYQEILKSLSPKLIDYHLFGNTKKLMTIASNEEVHEFSREILNFAQSMKLIKKLDELETFYYHAMNEKEQQKIKALELNDIISELQSFSYKIKYIENVGYVIVKHLGHLFLDGGSEHENYSAKIFDTKELVKNEIITIYNKLKK